jgi:hypothetical protein
MSYDVMRLIPHLGSEHPFHQILLVAHLSVAFHPLVCSLSVAD